MTALTDTSDDGFAYLQMPMSMICLTSSSFGKNFSRLKIRLLPSLSSPPPLPLPSFSSPPRLKERADDLEAKLVWTPQSFADERDLPDEEEAWKDGREEGLVVLFGPPLSSLVMLGPASSLVLLGPGSSLVLLGPGPSLALLGPASSLVLLGPGSRRSLL